MKKMQNETKQNESLINLKGYEEFLRDLKARIRSTQIKAALSVNQEMIRLYWEIGKGIVERQERAGWGDAVVEQIAKDLRHEFPEMKGFSRSNIFSMRQFYLTYRYSDEFVQQLAGQIPWWHNLVIISRVKEPVERDKTIAEYALRDMNKPIGVSEYRHTAKLPENLSKSLPDPGELERLMEEDLGEKGE